MEFILIYIFELSELKEINIFDYSLFGKDNFFFKKFMYRWLVIYDICKLEEKVI